MRPKDYKTKVRRVLVINLLFNSTRKAPFAFKWAI